MILAFLSSTHAVPEILSKPPDVPTSAITSTSATVSWDPLAPEDQNGDIIQYKVNYKAISSDPRAPSSGRRRRQSGGNSVAVECIRGGEGNVNRNMTVPGTQTSAVLENLSESRPGIRNNMHTRPIS